MLDILNISIAIFIDRKNKHFFTLIKSFLIEISNFKNWLHEMENDYFNYGWFEFFSFRVHCDSQFFFWWSNSDNRIRLRVISYFFDFQYNLRFQFIILSWKDNFYYCIDEQFQNVSTSFIFVRFELLRLRNWINLLYSNCELSRNPLVLFLFVFDSQNHKKKHFTKIGY